MKKIFIIIAIVLTIMLPNFGCSYFWPDDGGNKVLLAPEVIAPRTAYYSEKVVKGTVTKTANLTMQNQRGMNYFSAEANTDNMNTFASNPTGTFTVYVMKTDSPDYGKYLEYPATVVKQASTTSMSYVISITSPVDKISKDVLTEGTSGIFSVVIGKKENVIAVPKSAVRQYFKDWIIGVKVDGARQDRIIKIGLVGDEKVEVVSGLSAGEDIVFR